jgi:protein gp37
MTENSRIEWTDHTFNPWYGCTKISPGCDHCYAEGWAKRSGLVEWGGQRRRSTIQYWQQPFRWNDAAKAAGERHRVFCASLADVFDNTVSDHWRWDLFALIRSTPHLDWLLLTKRIGNAREMLNSAASATLDDLPGTASWDPDPWPNVWLGSTVVNQAEADRDIPKLLATPARRRFLSIEPMLGPIDLTRIFMGSSAVEGGGDLTSINFYVNALRGAKSVKWPPLDWVIAGGESGGGARPMHPAWARSLRDQCSAVGVPFLFKQWGEWAPLEALPDLEGKGRFNVQLNGYTAVRAGKKLAGRSLDGRIWNEFPEAVA